MSKEYYIVVYDKADSEDPDLDVSLHVSFEAACIQRCIYVIESIKSYLERMDYTFDDLPTEVSECLLQHIADERYAEAFAVWDAWTRETGQDDWIDICSATPSKRRPADVVASLDSILEITPKKEEKKEFTSGEIEKAWEQVHQALAAQEEANKAEVEEKPVCRHGVVEALVRTPVAENQRAVADKGKKHFYNTELEIRYYDSEGPRTERICVLEDLSDDKAKSPYYINKRVTVAKTRSKVTVYPKTEIWGSLTEVIDSAKKAKITGGACAVPNIPFEVLSRPTV